MTAEQIAGTIHAQDIEELNYCVWPWDLRMRQMSCGEFRADLDFAQVNGILLTHERWSRSVCADGATPAGYLAIGGSNTKTPFRYSGEDICHDRVAFSLDTTDTEFATPDEESHWVMLVPIEQVVDSLDEDLAATRSDVRRTLNCDSRVVHQLRMLVVQSIASFRHNSMYQTDELLRNAIHAQLLEGVIELLANSNVGSNRGSPRKRFLACRRALNYAEKLNFPISVDELAVQAGVSRRVLEIGFRETLEVSPHRYLRNLRLNGMHRDLRRASPQSDTVTETATYWGFTDLGRTAVVYRELFGESPSETLKRRTGAPPARLSDALHGCRQLRESD